MFDKEKFDDLCWMMTSKKNFKQGLMGKLLSERDFFKLFCLFNLLSEDRYPLVMIPEEVTAAHSHQTIAAMLIFTFQILKFKKILREKDFLSPFFLDNKLIIFVFLRSREN